MMKPGMKIAVWMIFLSAFLSGCKRVNEKHTDSGMKYIVHSEAPGPKAKQGDFVTIEMVYKTETDSVLFNSGQNNMPMRFQLQSSPFPGSMEEGLTYMAAGDSATFFVSADSMVRRVFSKMTSGKYERPSFLKTGSFLKFDVKLLRIQTEPEAAEEMYRESDKHAALEKAGIEKYLKDHHVAEPADSNGIYVIKTFEGKGTMIDTGKAVLVNYTGKFLNGVVFDSNEPGRPYSFFVGSGKMIKGWDLAFSKLRQGDRATFIFPSRLAYGEEGLRNKMNGTFFIQPNTPLVYEVDVVAVK